MTKGTVLLPAMTVCSLGQNVDQPAAKVAVDFDTSLIPSTASSSVR